MERQLEKVANKINEFYAPVFMIHGNHEEEENLKKTCSNHPNITFIHKAVHHFDDYVFLGYGGGGFSNADPDFKNIAEKFFTNEVQGKRRIIMALHGPPHGTRVDRIGGEHTGDRNFRKFIDDIQPHLVICGHLHENAGKNERIGRTMIINPGPQGVIVDI